MTKEEMLTGINSRSGFNKHNGIRVTDFGEGFCVVEAELKPEAQNPWGMAHGGFVYSMCDVAAGVCVAVSGKRGVTLSSNLYFLHRSEGSRLRCEGRIAKPGSNVVLVDTSVYDETGRNTARGTFEVYIVKEETPDEALRNSK